MEGRQNMVSKNGEEKENEKESSMDVDLEWQTPERGTILPDDQVTANEPRQEANAADEPLA